MRVKIIALIATVLSTSVFGNEECKIVNGFNLCQDAITIAANTKNDIGVHHEGSEYILRSVLATGMRVITLNESIYSEEDMENLLSAKTISKAETKLLKKNIMKQATKRLCKFYSVDEFVNDGGSFEVNYKYKGGGIFHTVLAEKGACREIQPTLRFPSPTP